jgi:nucleotide-binding universal stress UspA family protein
MSEDPARSTTSGSGVFVSYASPDAAMATAIVEHLEQHGMRCWVAPRDVKPGSVYADAIIRAINESKAVLLVLSASAMASQSDTRCLCELRVAGRGHRRCDCRTPEKSRLTYGLAE